MAAYDWIDLSLATEMIRSWLFTFMQPYTRAHPDPFDPETTQRAIRWHIDVLFPKLEAVGFEGIFFSEHHFHGNMSASPHLYIAATAMRTHRLRLGVMGSVLPLHQPWRVAEEIAILDHLTGGRLEIGYSSGTGPQELLLVGIPAEELRPRFDEALDVIDGALAELEHTHHGRFWNLERLCITPRVLQRDPPKWMTVVTASSARIAAQRGYKICTAFMSARDAAEVFDAYREAAAKAARPAGPDRLGLRRRCLVWDTDREAEQLGAEVLKIALERTGNLMKRMIARGANPLIGVAHLDKQIMASRRAEAVDAPASKFLSEPDEWIVGSPETVAAKIIDQCRTTGAGHFLAYTLGSMETREMEHSTELWREVIPLLQKAKVVSPCS
jgi:alkanesulfonate monooxygenase SsuD/methylene tetrahydromethanopterin reductase-like flavin-dependent oxidoreductase (luciferase family)